MKSFAVAMFFSLVVCVASAQRVYIEHDGGDMGGDRFVFAFKEALRASASYAVVDVADENTIRLDIITMAIPNANGGPDLGTAVSFVACMGSKDPDNIFECSIKLDHQLATMGTERETEMAKTMLAKFDKTISTWRQAPNVKTSKVKVTGN